MIGRCAGVDCGQLGAEGKGVGEGGPSPGPEVRLASTPPPRCLQAYRVVRLNGEDHGETTSAYGCQ
jgi:hypothetical protein